MDLLTYYGNQEELNTLPEVVQGFFTKDEDSDGFVLNAKAVTVGKRVFAVENVAGLKTVIGDLKAKNEKKADQLKAFEGIDDPASALAAMAKLKELGDIDNLDNEVMKKVSVVEQQLESQYAGQIKKLKSELEMSVASRDKAMKLRANTHLETEAMKAFAKEKVIPEWQDVMLAKIRQNARCRVNGDEDSLIIDVLDESGTPRISTKSRGGADPMDLGELVREFKTVPTLAVCFEGSRASGSGLSGGPANRVSGNSIVLTKEQASDVATYRAAKEQAAKANVPMTLSDS